MAVEQASYQVLLQEGPYELRLYEPMTIVASPESDPARQDGFSKLFQYISGNNEASRKIAMTAPVFDDLDEGKAMTAFVMPKQFHLQDLPKPNDPSLEPKEVQARRVAVVRFSGAVTANSINKMKADLMDWINKKQMNVTGKLQLARYNPPYVPTMLRRNELMIEVSS